LTICRSILIDNRHQPYRRTTMTRTSSHLLAIAAALVLTIATFQQAVSVPVAAMPVAAELA
jgi:hypothetical protein